MVLIGSDWDKSKYDLIAELEIVRLREASAGETHRKTLAELERVRKDRQMLDAERCSLQAQRLNAAGEIAALKRDRDEAIKVAQMLQAHTHEVVCAETAKLRRELDLTRQDRDETSCRKNERILYLQHEIARLVKERDAARAASARKDIAAYAAPPAYLPPPPPVQAIGNPRRVTVTAHAPSDISRGGTGFPARYTFEDPREVTVTW